MAVTQEALAQALKSVLDPNTGKDFVSTKALKNVQIHEGDVSFDIELGYPAKSQMPALRKALVAAAKTVAGVENVSVNIATKVISHAVQRGVQLMPNGDHTAVVPTDAHATAGQTITVSVGADGNLTGPIRSNREDTAVAVTAACGVWALGSGGIVLVPALVHAVLARTRMRQWAYEWTRFDAPPR